MKHLTLFLFFIIAIFNSSLAQITLEQKDFYKAGTSFILYNGWDSNLDGFIDYGIGGPNEFYDFSKVLPLLNDTGKIFFNDPASVKVKHPFNNANIVIPGEVYADYFYGSPNFTNSDFPSGNKKLEYRSSYGQNSTGYFLAELIYSGWPGSNSGYYFNLADEFEKDTLTIKIMDPSKTGFAAQHPNATVAKLIETEVEKGDTLLWLYHFYTLNGNNLQWTGVSAKLDTGIFSGNASGIYTTATAKLTNPVTNFSTDFKMGYSNNVNTSWNAKINLGTREIHHHETIEREFTIDGYGFLYLPQDSFEAFRAFESRVTTTVDSIFFMNNFMGLESNTDTTFQYSYYSKGLGHPVLIAELADTFFYDVIKADYFSGMNPVTTSAPIYDTIYQEWRFMRTTASGTEDLGFHAIINPILWNGNYQEGKDTVSGLYPTGLTRVSDQFKYQNTIRDTGAYTILFMDNTMELHQKLIVEGKIDGYGKLFTPFDTIKSVLRYKYNEISHNRMKTFDSAGNLISSEYYIDTTGYIEFWAKGPNYPVVRITLFNKQAYNISLINSDGLTTSVRNQPLTGNFKTFPNPSQGRVTISRDNNKPFKVDIVNSKGQIILHDFVPSGSASIDLSEEGRGMYFIIARELNGENVYKEKIIIH